MRATKHTTAMEEPLSGGFGTVDEKGRLSLPKPVRQAMGVEAGSSVAYVVLDHALLLIPQDEHLAALMRDASQVLADVGLTAQDVIAELPAARAEIMAESYSAEFLGELMRLHQQMQSGDAPQ